MHRRHNHIHTPTSDIALPQRYNPFFFFFFVSCRAYFIVSREGQYDVWSLYTVYLRPPVYRVVNTTHTHENAQIENAQITLNRECALSSAPTRTNLLLICECAVIRICHLYTHTTKRKKKREGEKLVSLSLYFSTLYICSIRLLIQGPNLLVPHL